MGFPLLVGCGYWCEIEVLRGLKVTPDELAWTENNGYFFLRVRLARYPRDSSGARVLCLDVSFAVYPEVVCVRSREGSAADEGGAIAKSPSGV